MGTTSAYPPLHTAEHLLTAILARHFPEMTNYASRFKSRKCVFEFDYPHPIPVDQVKAVESELQAIISAAAAVTTYELDREQAGFLPNLHQVPADAGTVRVVRIGEYDMRACIGQHVSHTYEIEHLRLPTFMEIETGRWRVNLVVD
ncbi:MAG: hypothetical protein EXR62_12965 [Chloroflexi bacterium]|nr:hypothetical protein [Chloroflexota bacterium]